MMPSTFFACIFLIHGLVQVHAGACYHCVSSDFHLEPTLRRQLKTQIDVFFWQIGMQWNACSRKVDPQNPSIEGQICSKYDLCVTLQPNVNGSTFVVRGCLENVLRHNWREDARLHEEGCYMVRSLPMYPNKRIIDYVICVCRGDYCNEEHSASFVEDVGDFPSSEVLHLLPKAEALDQDRPQYEVSSAAILSFTMIIVTASLFFELF